MLIDYAASTQAVIRKELHFVLFASDPAYQLAIDRFLGFKDEFNEDESALEIMAYKCICP